jgi:hypothetical protein
MASKPTGRPRGRPKTAKPKISPRERGRPKINLCDSPDRRFLALKTALVACEFSDRRAAIVTFLFSECAEVPPENEFAAGMPAKDGMIAIGFHPLKARGDDKKKLLQRIEGRCSTFRKKRVLSQAERTWLANIGTAFFQCLASPLSGEQKKLSATILTKRAGEPELAALFHKMIESCGIESCG